MRATTTLCLVGGVVDCHTRALRLSIQVPRHTQSLLILKFDNAYSLALTQLYSYGSDSSTQMKGLVEYFLLSSCF